MLTLLLSFAFAQEPCTVKISNQELQRRLDSAELGFVKADREQVTNSMQILSSSIGCLKERLTPELAARYHIIQGFYAWVSNDETKTKRSFAVARKTDPKAQIPEHIFPQNHIIHIIYSKIEPADYEDIQSAPPKGAYCFDGYLMPRRPKDTPTLLQIIDNKDILHSTYLMSNAPLPTYKRKRSHQKPVVLGLSAASFLTGVGFQIHSQFIRQQYERDKEALFNDAVAGSLQQQQVQVLDEQYQAHLRQYRISVAGFAGASLFLGASFFVEW